MIHQHEGGYRKGQSVGQRHAEPYPFQSVDRRQPGQSRKQEEQLAGEGQEDGNPGFSDGLEKLGDDNLCPYDREGQDADSQGEDGVVHQFLAVGKHSYEESGKQFSYGKSHGGDDTGRRNTQFQGTFHPTEMTGPVVIARNGLHAHGDTHHNHDKQHLDAVEDAEGSDGHVAPVGK